MSDKKSTETKTNKVSWEMAEDELERFIDAMDLDLDTADMDDNDKAVMINARGRMIRAIERGTLVITSEGMAEYHPVKMDDLKPILFHELDGAALLAIDKRKATAQVSQMFTMMAQMCKVSPSYIGKLKGIDLKVCQDITVLLMA